MAGQDKQNGLDWQVRIPGDATTIRVVEDLADFLVTKPDCPDWVHVQNVTRT